MNNQEMMELSTVDKSDFEELVKECTASGIIDQNLYTEYDVKRGLRDSNGNGVLTGLTEISDVLGNQSVHGRKRDIMLRSLSREAALTDSDLRKQHIFCYSEYFQTRIS